MNIQQSIISQYRASLAMLRQAIEKCPEPLWDDPSYSNRFWHVAYHVLLFTHFYLGHGPEAFQPWAKGRPDLRRLSQPGGEPYTKEEIIEYYDRCLVLVESMVPTDDLEAPSGFDWLPFNRLETHFYNLRHLQHHTGELFERSGAAGNILLDWVIKG